MGVTMEKRTFSKSRFILIALAVLVGSAVMPVFCAETPNGSLVNDAKRALIDGGKKLIKKGAEFRKNKQVRSYAKKGAVIAGVVLSAIALKYIHAHYLSNKRLPTNLLGGCGVVVSDKEAVQIVVPQQNGLTCGFHALINGRYIKNWIENDCLGNIGDEVAHTGMLDALGFFIQYLREDTNKEYCKAGAYIYGKLENENENENEDEAIDWLAKAEDWFNDVNTRVLGADDIARLIKAMELDDCIVCHDGANFPSEGMFSFAGLKQKVTQFKNADNRKTMPIILNPGGHWIVDVLHKTDEGEIRHIVADSMNWNQLTGNTVKCVMRIVKEVG